MLYHAKIRIDDDRWCKHPYSVDIVDEDGNWVAGGNFLDDEDECYRIIEKFKAKGNQVSDDVETEFY